MSLGFTSPDLINPMAIAWHIFPPPINPILTFSVILQLLHITRLPDQSRSAEFTSRVHMEAGGGNMVQKLTKILLECDGEKELNEIINKSWKTSGKCAFLNFFGEFNQTHYNQRWICAIFRKILINLKHTRQLSKDALRHYIGHHQFMAYVVPKHVF